MRCSPVTIQDYRQSLWKVSVRVRPMPKTTLPRAVACRQAGTPCAPGRFARLADDGPRRSATQDAQERRRGELSFFCAATLRSRKVLLRTPVDFFVRACSHSCPRGRRLEMSVSGLSLS
ncbi:hypothetical protein MRX96_028765 [Rhipicephalus microplus]